MPYLKTPRGLNWHYEDEGAGQTLLFLHGFGVNKRIWRQQFKYFSESFRVLAIDLPGHGKSAWQKVTLFDIAHDIEIILQQLGCERIGIVASSFGGLVALKLLELNQQRINFLIFTGSQPKFCKAQDYPYGLDQEKIQKLAKQLESDYPSMVNIFFRSLFTPHERATRRYKWIQTFKKTDFIPNKEALLDLLAILECEDLRKVFYSLTVPILFINGSEDYICQKSFYLGLEEKIPSARFHWFERCGHFPFLSQPHEFNAVVEKFINQI